MTVHRLHLRKLHEDRPGAALRAPFSEYWPAYQRWMRRADECSVAECEAMLRRHMPELVPVYEKLRLAFSAQLVTVGAPPGASDLLARFLTLYRPPRVVRACSQLVVESDRGPVLFRSYDHYPQLFDGVVLTSDWLGSRTLALTDCLWGALDGVNDRGLAVALAFGGRDAAGHGFAAPLLTRYLLHTCASVDDARSALARVPVYMPYTFVVADASGDFSTAFVGPDREARIIKRRASANHQGQVDWPRYCKQTKSVERLDALENLLTDPAPEDAVRASFLRSPLWRRDYHRGSGTLYVAEYRPAECSVDLLWPGRAERFALDDTSERAVVVDLATRAAG